MLLPQSTRVRSPHIAPVRAEANLCSFVEDFMLCKSENRDPEHCLKEGRRVTRCAIDLCVYSSRSTLIRDTFDPTQCPLTRNLGSQRCAIAALQSLNSIGTVSRSITRYAPHTLILHELGSLSRVRAGVLPVSETRTYSQQVHV